MPIALQIKSEVQRLNNKDAIWAKISRLDAELNFQNDKKRFIFAGKESDKSIDNVTPSLSEMDKKNVWFSIDHHHR